MYFSAQLPYATNRVYAGSHRISCTVGDFQMAHDAVQLFIELLKHLGVVLRAYDLSGVPSQPLARFQSSYNLGNECFLVTPTWKHGAAEGQPNPTAAATGLLNTVQLTVRDASKLVSASADLRNYHLLGLQRQLNLLRENPAEAGQAA